MASEELPAGPAEWLGTTELGDQVLVGHTRLGLVGFDASEPPESLPSHGTPLAFLCAVRLLRGEKLPGLCGPAPRALGGPCRASSAAGNSLA
mmetsp:Transcript_19735/g.54254  ORF Transcript_19735/g.54254 Transcript_19735/m.54254 type:complete len:92 (+) Transcript_19735:232-507(+)